MTISTYFTKLKGLWDELDTYRALPTCNQMKAHDEQREEDRLMQFLMGLHDTYNVVHSSQSTHGVHSQDTNSSPGHSTDQLQQLAHALSMMTQNQKSPGNSDAYANVAGLGYGEDDWLGRDVKFSKTIFPFMSATHPTSTLPYISPDFMDNWQSSPSLPTNIPSSQPQPTEPATIQESTSSIQSPLAEPKAAEDISPNPTQPLTSSPPAQSAEPILTSSDSIIPSSPPPCQSLRPKQPPAWHRDYRLSAQVNPPSTVPSSTPETIQRAGYQQSKADYFLYTKAKGTSFTAILIYVDDILLTGNNLQEIERLKKFLLKRFRIKDLGDLKYFLGIEFSRSKKGIFMSQRKYALDISQDSGLLGVRPDKFPMEQNLNLTPTDGILLSDPTKYRRLVGRLIYLTVTRPDIVYSVRTLSQFMHEPHKPHWNAAIRILKYIKGNHGQGLLFPSTNNLALKAFYDSDWGGCCTTRSHFQYLKQVPLHGVGGCQARRWQAAGSGQTWDLDVPAGTTGGRIWPRTNCNFDRARRGSCQTGDCNGLLQCQGYGNPPNSTLADFGLNQFQNLDFFDVSLVDGFNVVMELIPTSSGSNRGPTCTADINGQCPNELRAPGGCNNP
ncbi:hypothetical protein RJ639_004616 [Escallonia herrerae]|uniref:Reverse transcriptase Ty1/copia-type domain-containing protein n=1 Tax=Escallonia herrerae TaxID=1293975 RepID=A0AA88W191_9ASTE|nr:hypothetical protein RJ639_004616 [Escallonia herrerae]